MIDFREIQQLPPFENPVTPGSGAVPTGPQYGMETAIPGQNPTGAARKLTLGMIYGMFRSAVDEGYNDALIQSIDYSETERTVTVTLRNGMSFPSNPIPVAGSGNPNPGLISQADWNLLQQLDIDAGDLLTQLNAFNLRLVVLEGGGRAYYVTNAQWAGGFTGSESTSNLQSLFNSISGRTQPNENDIMVHVSSGTSWVYVNSAWNYISSPGFAADGASGNLTMFDNNMADNGNLADSGISAADIVTHASLNATSNTDTDLQTGYEPSKPLGTVLQTIWNKIRSVANWAIYYFIPKFSSAQYLAGTASVTGRPALVIWEVYAPNQVLSIDASHYSESEYVDIALLCNSEASLIGTYISISTLDGTTYQAIGCVGYENTPNRVKMIFRLFKDGNQLMLFASWWAKNIAGQI